MKRIIEATMKHAKLGNIFFTGSYIVSMIEDWEHNCIEYIAGLAFLAGVAVGKHWEREKHNGNTVEK